MKKMPKEVKKLIIAAEDALAALVEALREQRDLAEEFFEGKSERWQEGDAGDSYRSFIDAIECKADEVEAFQEELSGIDSELDLSNH